MIAYTRTVAPVLSPLSVEDVATHLRITDVLEHPLLDTYLRAATEHMERTLGIRWATQTWTMILDWPDVPTGTQALEVRGAPLATVTGIAYVDLAGAAQTWIASSYVVDTSVLPGRIYPAYNLYWPDVRDQPKAMTITYTCGWASRALIPPPLQHALRLLIGHWYEHREATTPDAPPQDVPRGYDALVAPYKQWVL
jgi:uncharacterized phiE125 gp8 family phage protein